MSRIHERLQGEFRSFEFCPGFVYSQLQRIHQVAALGPGLRQLAAGGIQPRAGGDNRFFQLVALAGFCCCAGRDRLLRGLFGFGAVYRCLDRVFDTLTAGGRHLRTLLRGQFAGGALGFPGRFLLFNPCLARLEAHTGLLRLGVFSSQLQYFGLGGAVVLHQRNIAGAGPGTGAALDTVKQVMPLQFVEFPGLGEPEQLLRQQAGGAGLGAHATAYAGLRRWRDG